MTQRKVVFSKPILCLESIAYRSSRSWIFQWVMNDGVSMVWPARPLYYNCHYYNCLLLRLTRLYRKITARAMRAKQSMLKNRRFFIVVSNARSISLNSVAFNPVEIFTMTDKLVFNLNNALDKAERKEAVHEIIYISNCWFLEGSTSPSRQDQIIRNVHIQSTASVAAPRNPTSAM